jgi:hypothetical protein
MTLTKRSAIRVLLLGVAALVMFWGLLPLVYFALWPATVVAWAVAAVIARRAWRN